MTWFKVDDAFHSHPKVLATDPAALGLWVVAGSWSSSHLTEGWVSDEVLPRLLPDAERLAIALVTAGLWTRRRGGHQFHDWLLYQPSSKEVRALHAKRVQAGRIGGLARAKARSKTQANAKARASPGLVPPSRPSSSSKKEGGDARRLRGGGHPADAPPAADPCPYDPDDSGTCRTCGMPKGNRRHQEEP